MRLKFKRGFCKKVEENSTNVGFGNKSILTNAKDRGKSTRKVSINMLVCLFSIMQVPSSEAPASS